MDPLRSWAIVAALGLAAASQISVFPDITRPEQHPRFGTTLTRPPTWDTFMNRTQFATLRSFNQDGNFNILDYQSTLANYSQLGDVMWPVWQTIMAPNFANVTAYLAANGFYMTDLWGYVPGSGPGPEMWQAFTPPPENLRVAEQLLGDRWLGMDVGEQDGRYVGGYANQHAPLNAPGIQQRAFFEEHFQAMYSQLGGRVVALQSLTFAHSMAQSGTFTVVGCESGQALVNAQLFYAVARGAAKQYGTLYFGNVSVYNRFGYKHYPSGGYGGTRVDNNDYIPPPMHSESAVSRRLPAKRTAAPSKSASTLNYTCTNQGEGGAQCGTSLSLMTKLMFSQIFYNSGYVSFENSWFEDGTYTLSPIGELQIAAELWLSKFGSPGTHMATIGLVVDYAAGWTSPRNLYQDYNEGDLYYVWGNLPYSPTRGDYLTDSILRLVYPNYQDSSYFHNETGFSSPTPFGDSLDFLLSDSPAWLLSRYDFLLLAGTPQTEPGLLRSKFESALAGGANIITWAGPLGAWGAAGLAKCFIAESEYAGQWTSRCVSFPAGTAVIVSLPGGNVTIEETASFSSCTLQCTGSWTPTALAWVGSMPVAWAVSGAGVGNTLTVFGSPFGAPSTGIIVSDPGIDATLPSPYPLLGHVEVIVNAALASHALFSVPGLTFTVCRRGPSNSSEAAGQLTEIEYTLLISNPTLEQAPLSITSNIGDILFIEELPTVNESFTSAAGYLPDGYAGANLGMNSNTTIAGKCVATRTFRVVVDESDTSNTSVAASIPSTVRVLPTVPPLPRPLGFALNLRDLSGLPVATLRAAALSFPSLAQTFDTLVVDWTYLKRSNTAALVAEAAYLAQTGLTGAVDFSSGLNLFPTLRLCNNSAPEYADSLAAINDVLTKTAAMGWSHALLSLHRTPENNMDEPTAMALEAQTLRENLAATAAALNISLHLRNVPGKSPVSSLSDLLAFMTSNNLNGTVRPAPGLAGMIISGDTSATLTQALSRPESLGSVAFVYSACPAYDPNAPSRWWADTAPMSVGSCTSAPALQALIATTCKVGVCVTPAGPTSPAHPRVVLVVDAYIGAGAFSAPLSPWETPAQSPSGAALDLAYAEAAWLLQSALPQ